MRKVRNLLAAGVILVAGGATAYVASNTDTAVGGPSPAQNVFCNSFVPNMESSSLYAKWASQNKAERDAWTGYSRSVCSSNVPVAPSLATYFGKALINAGQEVVVSTAPPPTTAPTTTLTPPPTSTVVTTTPPPPPTTTTSGSPQPTGITGTYALKFQDEFNGSSLDLSKWRPNWLAGTDTAVSKPVNSAEDQCSDPRNATVSGGTLKMLLEHRSCAANNGVTYPNAGVTMETFNDGILFTYGVFEARMWTPPGTGLAYNWAQWWTNTNPYTEEIDIVETLTGGQPCWHYHYTGGAPGGCVNIGSGWHTYGAKWSSGRIDWYYDGKAVGTISSGVTSHPMYLVLGYGHNKANPLNAPATVEVDYVRVWQ
jgi:beta-glucanase (GH16 family)